MKRIFVLGALRAKRRPPEYARIAGIIKQAHVNGGEYFGDKLTESRWQWPEPDSTWFSKRLRMFREGQAE